MKWNHQPMVLLDKWAHILHVPKVIQHPICNRFDTWLGLYDEDYDVPYDDYVEQDCS